MQERRCVGVCVCVCVCVYVLLNESRMLDPSAALHCQVVSICDITDSCT